MWNKNFVYCFVVIIFEEKFDYILITVLYIYNYYTILINLLLRFPFLIYRSFIFINFLNLTSQKITKKVRRARSKSDLTESKIY